MVCEVFFHEGAKCLDEGPKGLFFFKKRAGGAEVVGVEVSDPRLNSDTLTGWGLQHESTILATASNSLFPLVINISTLLRNIMIWDKGNP